MNTAGFVMVLAGAFVGVEALKQFSKPSSSPAGPVSPTQRTDLPSPGSITSDRTPVAGSSLDVSSLLQQAGAVASDIPVYLVLLSRENGGADPHITNPTPVIVNGHEEHATGLWQMLPSTFMENAVGAHTDIYNPLDNTLAMLNYVRRRYGSPGQIPGLYSPGYEGY